MTIGSKILTAKAGRAAAVLVLLAGAACSQRDAAAPAQPVANAPAPAPAAPAPAPAPTANASSNASLGSAQAPVPNTPATSADGRDRRIRVTNESGQRVTLIKGSAASDGNWGNDRIPSGTLPSGNVVMLDFNDGNGECVYDLQATMEDGTTREQRRVNVCTETDWVITRNGVETR